MTAVVRQVSGEVFVKLPARGLYQAGGFIPLKGVAAVPVGSTVDTRKGEIELDSAANGFAASDRRAKRQSARIKAGLFVIKQKRAKRGVAKKSAIGTDIGLLSPPGAEAACATGPAKGESSAPCRWSPRASSARSAARAPPPLATRRSTPPTAATAPSPRSAAAASRSRSRERKKPVVVRAGGAYLAKAKLFAAKKKQKR